MAPIKCCVNGCTAINQTHRLYSFPKDDNLRALWLSFLVPVNSDLLGLSKDQLLNKRVCQKHFDKYQLDGCGNRLKDGYPCLFSAKEIEHGVPLSCSDQLNDHNYSKMEVDEEILQNPELTQENDISCNLGEHSYSRLRLETPITSSFPYSEPTGTTSSFSQLKESTEIDPQWADRGTEKNVPNVKRTQNAPKTVISGSRSHKLFLQSRPFIKKMRKLAIMENKTQKPFLERFDAAKILSQSKLFNKNFEKMSQQAQDFLVMQLKMADKKKKAMRYTTNEKHLALTLMKESPKGYRLLQKIFNLPSRRTLNRLAENITFDVGLNDNIFKLLKNKTREWDTRKKLCSIMFDEVALTPHLTYVESKDEIRGFKDFGHERELRLCDHALVFMIKGICSNWRQPISFYFCEGTTAAAVVVKILKEVVTKLAQTDLIPLALVCDQGSTFRTAINMLKMDTERSRILNNEYNDGTIDISGLKLSVVFDPPHLLKGLRNNLLTKDMIFKDKVATWKDIETVYVKDCQLGHTRMNKKLTEHHIYADKMKKMKVSVAAQTLSATTSGMLKYTALFKTTVADESVSESMLNTGNAVEFIDKLFDSVNGSRGSAVSGKLRGPIRQNSQQIFHFWREAKEILKNITYIDTNSKKAIKNNKTYKVRVPSLNGWITTIESFERLSNLLFNNYNIEYFYPRNINQDPLENFFGRIRAINYRNVNPDANTFVNAFKSLIFSNVMGPHSIYANCEDDGGKSIVDFVKLISSSNNVGDNENIGEDLTSNVDANVSSKINRDHLSTVDEDKENYFCGPMSINQSLNPQNERLRVHSSAYTAGYMCRRMTKKFKCKKCSDTYIQKERDVFHRWIEQREYSLLKQNNLTYPSKKFLILYRDVSGLIHDLLNKYAHKKSIKKLIKKEINKKYDLSWLGCSHHEKELREWVLNLILRTHLHNWCNILNKILKGGVHDKLLTQMSIPQQIAFNKYKANKLRGRKK